MGKLPRKIDQDRLIGYVVSVVGIFPCEDLEDKEEIMALLNLFFEGNSQGCYDWGASGGEFPQLIAGTPSKYRNAHKILFSHLQINFNNLEKEFNPAIMNFLTGVLNEKKKDSYFFTLKNLSKVLSGKLFKK